MKKAWEDIKSFVTVTTTIGYLILTFLGKMTPEYQDLYKFIIIFYFGTQAEKVSQYLKKNNQSEKEVG